MRNLGNQRTGKMQDNVSGN